MAIKYSQIDSSSASLCDLIAQGDLSEYSKADHYSVKMQITNVSDHSSLTMMFSGQGDPQFIVNIITYNNLFVMIPTRNESKISYSFLSRNSNDGTI